MAQNHPINPISILKPATMAAYDTTTPMVLSNWQLGAPQLL